jgi:uncharacterized protein YhfF
MIESTDVEACWTGYLRSLPAGVSAPSGYFEASAFGSEGEAELADELADLVERGIKTATSSLLRYYQEGNHPIERAGDCCIVLTSTGRPCCVSEMTEIRTIQFGEVDAAFAADYGEGERTLPWWREHLGDYYARHCAAKGWSFGEETPMVCKRFRVVFRCAEAGG